MARSDRDRASIPALAALILTAALASRVAHAQTASERETALSREQFQLGLDAAREGRWAQARDAFARAYALVPRPVVLLDLANAQVHTGQLVRGADSYHRFLRETTEGPAAAYRGAAEQALREVEAQIAHARLVIAGLRDDDRISVDDETVSHAALGADLPVDPGEHRVAITRPGAAAPSTATVSLGPGETREVRLDPPVAPAVTRPPAIVPPASVVLRPATSTETASHSSVLASPWLWGAVVVVLGGGIAATVIALGASGDGYTGTLEPGVVRVR